MKKWFWVALAFVGFNRVPFRGLLRWLAGMSHRARQRKIMRSARRETGRALDTLLNDARIPAPVRKRLKRSRKQRRIKRQLSNAVAEMMRHSDTMMKVVESDAFVKLLGPLTDQNASSPKCSGDADVQRKLARMRAELAKRTRR